MRCNEKRSKLDCLRFKNLPMKVLMLTPYLPYPPASGGQVRSYNLIKNLSKKHKITLFSLIKDEKEKTYIKELEKFCVKVRVFKRPPKPWSLKNILKTGFSLYPFLVVRNLSEEEKAAIQKELQRERYDLIHAENFYVMPHIPKTDTPILLTEQTILYRVYEHFVESMPWYFFWLKPIMMIDVLKLKFWEVYYWKHSDFLAAVSEDDREHIKELTGKRKVAVIPNGVDFHFYNKRIYNRNKDPTVLFGAADFHWMQNKEGAVLLLGKVWPLIKKAVPKAKLWIVGKTVASALKKYLNEKDILIEEVEDSRIAYQKAWVLAAPMKSGGGSRTKFFEAMASGLPIVTTAEGAEGIGAKNGAEIIIENDFKALAKKTAALLLNGKKSERVSENARDLVRKKYDWSQSAELLSKVYKEIGK